MTPLTTMTQRKRGRLQFGLKAFLAVATFCAILIGLFFPRTGTPLGGCADQGLQSVWIAPPEHAEIIAKCKESYPGVAIPVGAPIVTEKVLEEVGRCNFFNFQGRRYLHRVLYRSEVFLTRTYPPESIVVLLEYDHYHLNGGGCQLRNAK